jgi:hypothetical protein
MAVQDAMLVKEIDCLRHLQQQLGLLREAEPRGRLGEGRALQVPMTKCDASLAEPKP